jgi:hypothetical protein
MIKIVCLFTRKMGMSRDEFIDYYETNHAPLIARLLPQPYRYQRSYVVPGSMLINDSISAGLTEQPQTQPGAFDVITEAWFQTQQDYDDMLAARNNPETSGIIASDEARFMDRSKNIVFLAEERITK